MADTAPDSYRAMHHVRPIADWRPEFGPVLWWRYPIEAPPYHGTPEDAAWPGGLTHWTAVKAPGG